MDPEWSETGERYLIKLFRDYVFHQVDENDNPVIDFVHVIECLNKVRIFGRFNKVGCWITGKDYADESR
jgi:hypothetical protein